jgi:hypothetical protein
MASALTWSSIKMLKEIPQHVLKQMDELKQIQLAIFAEYRDLFLILVGYPKFIVKKFAKGGAVSYARY